MHLESGAAECWNRSAKEKEKNSDIQGTEARSIRKGKREREGGTSKWGGRAVGGEEVSQHFNVRKTTRDSNSRAGG